DGTRVLTATVALPRVHQMRLFEHRACGVADDLHLRPERIARMFCGDDRQLLRTQSYEIPDGEQPHEIDEALEERLVEGRIALLAHDGADAIRREPLAVRSVASERVEDVGNRHDHRAEIQLPAADVLRIAAEILFEVVLERDNRCKR